MCARVGIALVTALDLGRNSAAIAGSAEPRTRRCPRWAPRWRGRPQLSWARAATAAFVLQGIALLAYSRVLWDHFDLEQDFAVFAQARFLIERGVLDPYSTVRGLAYWTNHGEWVMWPLAWLTSPWPSAFTLLVVQDLCIAATGWVAWRWLADIVERDGTTWSRRRRGGTLGLGLAFLLSTPGTYFEASFDFHFQALAALGCLLAARDLWHHRGRAWVWIVLVCCCGDSCATYVAGLGLSVLAAEPRRWRTWVALLGAGAGVTGGLGLIGANAGSNMGSLYGYLVNPTGPVPRRLGVLTLARAALSHPSRFTTALWSARGSWLANVAPAGLLGAIYPWTLGVPLVVFASIMLGSDGFLYAPSFQAAPAYPFLAVGSAVLLPSLAVCLARRVPTWAAAGALLGILALAAGLAIGQFSRTHERFWLTHVDQAPALTTALARIHPGEQVVTTAQVAGRFADRRHLDVLGWTGYFTLARGPVVFVLDGAPDLFYPRGDVEAEVLARTLLVGEHAHLVAQAPQLWVISWVDRPGDTPPCPYARGACLFTTPQGTTKLLHSDQ